MTLSEVGTSFSDVLLALPVIGGFLLILAADRRPAARHLLAGLLIGAAVGLKLTNVVYAIGAAAAVSQQCVRFARMSSGSAASSARRSPAANGA